MKLYTINATPVINMKQARSIHVVKPNYSDTIARATLKLHNDRNIKQYPGVVAGVLEASGVSGCTIEQVMGFWKNKPEVSFKIQVASDSPKTLRKVCESLRDAFNQDAVMLTLPDNEVEFI